MLMDQHPREEIVAHIDPIRRWLVEQLDDDSLDQAVRNDCDHRHGWMLTVGRLSWHGEPLLRLDDWSIQDTNDQVDQNLVLPTVLVGDPRRHYASPASCTLYSRRHGIGW
jgi:hypothetical protein